MLNLNRPSVTIFYKTGDVIPPVCRKGAGIVGDALPARFTTDQGIMIPQIKLSVEPWMQDRYL